MIYTPPAGDAINFSWVDALAYTPPNGDAINLSWAESPDPDPDPPPGSGVKLIPVRLIPV